MAATALPRPFTPLPLLLLILLIVSLTFDPLPAMTTTTTTTTTLEDSDDQTSSRTATRRSVTSGVVRAPPSPGGHSPDDDLRHSCYSILGKDEADLLVQPWPESREGGELVYTTDHNVTLTCQLKDTARGQPPFVLISCCRPQPCDGWIQSEPGRGRTELTLIGQAVNRSFGELGCQFGCWRHNSTCGPGFAQGQFTPHLDCVNVPSPGLFHTLNFKELPRPLDFQCVSRNWEALSCTWTLTTGSFRPQDAGNEGLVSFSSRSLFSSSAYRNVSRPVVLSEDGRTLSVELALVLGNFSLNALYRFAFQLLTRYGHVTGNYSVVSSRAISQYEAVNSLKLTGDAADSTVLTLTWTLPQSARAWGFPYRYWIRVVATSAPWLEVNHTLPEFTKTCDECTETLTGLHAHVTYEVHVRFRHPDSVFWSDVASASGTTSEDVPSAAPDVMTGGYVRAPCDTGHCLTVYIKALRPEFRNGILTGYRLEVTQRGHASGPVSQPRAGEEKGQGSSSPPRTRSLTAPLDSGEGPLRACVRARTARGWGRAIACLEVPGRSDGRVPGPPQDVTVDYAASNGTYLVHWTRAGGGNGSSSGSGSSGSRSHRLAPAGDPGRYTVFWCQGVVANGTLLTCQSDLFWEHVGPNSTSLLVSGENLTRPRFESAGQSSWYFGVASSAGHLSSGLVRSDCTFDVENGRVPQYNFIFEDVKEREVTLKWSVKCDFPFLNARPMRYEVYYGEEKRFVNQSKCTGNKTLVEPQPGTGEITHVISGLEPGTRYLVCLRTFFAHGGRDTITLQTVETKKTMMAEKAPDDNTVIVVLAVVLPAILLMVIVVWLCLKSCMEKRKKFSSCYQQSERKTVWSVFTSYPTSSPASATDRVFQGRTVDKRTDTHSPDLLRRHHHHHHQHQHQHQQHHLTSEGAANRSSQDSGYSAHPELAADTSASCSDLHAQHAQHEVPFEAESPTAEGDAESSSLSAEDPRVLDLDASLELLSLADPGLHGRRPRSARERSRAQGSQGSQGSPTQGESDGGEGTAARTAVAPEDDPARGFLLSGVGAGSSGDPPPDNAALSAARSKRGAPDSSEDGGSAPVEGGGRIRASEDEGVDGPAATDGYIPISVALGVSCSTDDCDDLSDCSSM